MVPVPTESPTPALPVPGARMSTSATVSSASLMASGHRLTSTVRNLSGYVNSNLPRNKRESGTDCGSGRSGLVMKRRARNGIRGRVSTRAGDDVVRPDRLTGPGARQRHDEAPVAALGPDEVADREHRQDHVFDGADSVDLVDAVVAVAAGEDCSLGLVRVR